MKWESLGLLLLFLVPAGAGDPAPARVVQVREAVLRERPSFLGKIVKRLKYEEAVVVQQRKAKTSWLKVQHTRSKASGWLKESALHDGKTGLKKGGAAPDARAGKTTRSLAGRGFNEKVERARRADLRSQGSSIEAGYRTLDSLIARRGVFTIDPVEVGAFADEGELGGGR